MGKTVETQPTLVAAISAPDNQKVAARGWKPQASGSTMGMSHSKPRTGRWLVGIVAAILALYFCGSIWYGMVIPPFETPDEVYHYAFARHLAQGHPLPVQDEEATGPWQQEGSQAPLYYWLVGHLISSIDQTDFDELTVFNPRSNMGNPLYPGNKNRMLYSAQELPWRGTNLALHVGRLFSTILGLVTLATLFGLARLAFPAQSPLALAAVGLAAVIPQFIFISASFTNDNMIIAASAATLFWLARLIAVDEDTEIGNLAWIVLGILLGLAALSKLQGLGLWLLAACVGCWLAWRRREWRSLPRVALLVAVPALAIAGWWYWRNYRLYGDWTGMVHLVTINGMRSEPLEWGDFWHEFRGLRFSFWGLFGWFNILLPTWFYQVLDWVVALAVAGFIARVVGAFVPRWQGMMWTIQTRPTLRPAPVARTFSQSQEKHEGHQRAGMSLRAVTARRGLNVQLLAAAWLCLSFGLLLYWMIRAEGSQGRLLFPALTAFLVVWVAGIDFWLSFLPRWLRRAFFSALFLLLLGNTVYGGALLLPRSYQPPAAVTDLPPSAQPVHLFYGEEADLELVGIVTPDAMASRRFHAGDEVPITLYLRAWEALATDVELFIQLLDENGEVLGNVTSHPGWGRHPTSLWQPGMIYEDPYYVQIEKAVGTHSPLLARVYVGFVDTAHNQPALTPMVARQADGQEVTPFVAEVSLVSRAQPAMATHVAITSEQDGTNAVGAVFGDTIRLAEVHAVPAVQAGAVMTTTVLWETVAQPTTDYVGFVHLLDADGKWIAGFDRAPAGARYPTRYWRSADRILSQFPIELPAELTPGTYSLWAGLYTQDSQGAARLWITDANGKPVANQMVFIGDLRVGSQSP